MQYRLYIALKFNLLSFSKDCSSFKFTFIDISAYFNFLTIGFFVFCCKLEIFITQLAKRCKRLTITSILERDEYYGEFFLERESVNSNTGWVMGKNSKNPYIPRVGDFKASIYYMEGNLGYPTFEVFFLSSFKMWL